MTVTHAQKVVATVAAGVLGAGIVLHIWKKRRGVSDSEKGNSTANAKNIETGTSNPTVVLTQSSDEGRKVSVLVENINSTLDDVPESETEKSSEANSKQKGDTESIHELSGGDCLQEDNSKDNELKNNNQSDLHADITNDLDCVNSDSVYNRSDCRNLSSSSSSETDIKEHNGTPLNTAAPRWGDIGCETENEGLNPIPNSNKSNSSEQTHQSNNVAVEETIVSQVDNSLTKTEAPVCEQISVGKSKDGTVNENGTGEGSPDLTGSQSAAASPEQCQSSDSGISVQSEPETHKSGIHVVNCQPETKSKTQPDVTSKSKSSESNVFEFDLPTDLCGLLIGTKGRNVKKIMDHSGAHISLKQKIYTPDESVVTVRGKPGQIKSAMKDIKERFSARKFRNVVDFSGSKPDNPVLSPEIMQMHIPAGVLIDVIVSSVVTANHVFLQQPTHPQFHMLQRQNEVMNACYSQTDAVPEIPRPIEVATICAAPMYSGWFRGQVMNTYPEKDECDIRFVDYGGYMKTQGSAIKQIRSDFADLPFQAVECYLAHVVPPKGLEEFPVEASAVLEQLVQGHMLQAEMVAYDADGITPYVQLYIVSGDQLILVNRELVNKGVARWEEIH